VNPDGTAFDATGYSLQFQFQLRSLDPATDAWEQGGGSFSVVDASDGRWDYSLDATDTDTIGCYRLQVEALNGSDRRTFPQRGYQGFDVQASNIDQ
jgi:hypothetical protein